MAPPDPKALLRRLYDDVLGQGRLEVLDELLAPNFFDRNMPQDGRRGTDQFRHTVITFRDAFPHAVWTVSDVSVFGDVVTARIAWEGKHEGEFLEMAPTGEMMSAETISCFRLLNGQFVEHWSGESTNDLIDKLGFTKLPGPLA